MAAKGQTMQRPLPATLIRTTSTMTGTGGKKLKKVEAPNPFSLPDGMDIIALGKREKEEHAQLRELMKTLTLSQKTELQLEQTKRHLWRPSTPDAEEEAAFFAKKTDSELDDLTIQTRNRHAEKECLADYIKKKRELFLVQYALGVKNDEMRRLEESAQAEEDKLLRAENTYEADTAKFDTFLKENDRSSVEAIKQAEVQTKIKLDKMGEIKKLQQEIAAAKSSISKQEDLLRELRFYREFVYSLTPKDWLAQQTDKRKKAMAAKAICRSTARLDLSPSALLKKGTDAGRAATPNTKVLLSSSKETGPVSSASVGIKKRLSNTIVVSPPPRTPNVGQKPLDSPRSSVQSNEDDEEDESCDMYFTDPQQLLGFFSELEELNLSLIQNGQETEEHLQDVTERTIAERGRLNGDLNALRTSVVDLTTAIEVEEQRAVSLRMHFDFFSTGNADDREAELDRLDIKVAEVYKNCIGENEASINTLQMLTNIENRLEELFGKIEKLPREKVEESEKAREKLRRLRAREEQLESQREHQEERTRRAMERSQMVTKKTVGKPLMFRSVLPKKQSKVVTNTDALRAEQELLDEQRFFYGAD